ncbi:hypothetical protein OBBRIDRAFT_727299 [Obba rivulosa]|uniref:Protein kinase domain-containing protein n=1 Tax=Obba rivulosa TaxID=1052685 RepID=A0A8E2AX69_9APHY|nr:hypothetical protein OBBRIDRAFT_727299 [Obba rivulosa]
MKVATCSTLNTDDALAHAISLLEVSKEVSSAISSVPFLGAVIGSALSLISTIEKVRGDKERCTRLTRRVVNLLKDVEHSISTEPDAVDDYLMAQLALLQSVLTGMQASLLAIAKRTAARRFLHRGSIAATLDEHLDTIDETSRSFNAKKATELATNLMTFDKDQLRLFRFAEIRLERVSGSWQARSGISGDEWEGEWNGRLVTIRVLRPEHSEEVGVEALVIFSMLMSSRHPYLTQLLGRSHPTEPQKFLVIEKGLSTARCCIELILKENLSTATCPGLSQSK